MFKSPLRKNYLLNNQTSIITERREQSDSNSRSLSRSRQSNAKKSPNNSFQKIKKDQMKRKQENLKKIQQRVNLLNRNSNTNSIKVRSQSINTAYTYLNNCITGKNIQKNAKNKTNQNSGYDSILLKKNSPVIKSIFKQPVKPQLFQSQPSQISTEVPHSLSNNFMIQDQRPGFVRFSEAIIDNKPLNSRKSRSNRKSSSSILKNRKNAVSCNKIDSSYLKFRDKTLNQKEKSLDINKAKYKQIIESLKERYLKRGGKRNYNYFDLSQEQKYVDQLFPTDNQSIFFSKNKIQQIRQKYSQNSQYQFVEVSWRRISDLFNQNIKLVMHKQNSNQKVIKNDFSIISSDFVIALNAIKNVSQLFGKIFEPLSNMYEKHGVYCVKIYQQSSWKSIIIDDFIPVILIKDRASQQIYTESLFIDIESQKTGQQIEVWPFLLQKAYASYYSSYECLHSQTFKLIDFLQQILMTPSQCYYFPDNQEISEQAVKKLQTNIYQFPSSQSIIIGINIKTKEPCIIEKRQTGMQQQQVTIKTLKSERKMKIKHLFQIIHTFYLFLPFHFEYFNTSSVNISKSKKPVKHHPLARIKYRDQILVRTFNVDSQGPFSLAIRQKQKRFYSRNIKKYDYLWNRAIIVQKQFGNTYRWIEGKYSNEKSLNFNLYLEKGQYQIMIMPEAPPEQNMHDLTMLVLSNTQIGIQRKMYEENQKLLEIACSDIAQRKGVFRQLNDFTCSYSFIEKSTGLIIENVNNQRSGGGVAIMRSLAGLKAKVQICPFNMDFCINAHEANIHKRKYKKAIDILIDADTNFTVVLMMRGGIDERFLKVFKFGN